MGSNKTETFPPKYRPFNVFISCPTDLAPYRREALNVVEEQGYKVVAMDDLRRGGINPVDASLEAVAACDVYLGILGRHYGTISRDKARNPLRLSFTELEFREAQKLGKECIWFLVGEAGQAAKTRDPLEKVRKLQDLRTEIQREHVIDFLGRTGDLKKLVPSKLSHCRQLQRFEIELCRRYRSSINRSFTVVPNSSGPDNDTVSLAVARLFVSKIVAGLNQFDARDMQRFYVGISGGRTHHRLVQQLEIHRSIVGESPDYANLTFVAMNSAAISSRFHFTANYIVARLSEVFRGAAHQACLPGVKPGFKRKSRHRFDLLLGGAGEKDAYLKDWLADHHSGDSLPDGMLGDFCYVAVNAKGKAIRPESDPTLKHAADHVNSILQFRSLEDVSEPVMLSLFGQPQISASRKVTRKSEVGHTILSHLSNYHCMLDERTAQNLLGRQFCGYVLGGVLGADHQGGILYRAVRSKTSKSVIVRVVHQTHRRTMPRFVDIGRKKVAAEILISDPLGKKRASSARVLLRWRGYSFHLDPNVQRPGLWSATLARVAQDLIGKRKNQVLLDMGCGCGVVGCILASTTHCRSVVFADKDKGAVENAHKNAQKYKLPGHDRSKCIQTDLFSEFRPDSDLFDLVAFSPPFLFSDAGIDSKRSFAEVADWFGLEVALDFAEQVSQYLNRNGCAVLCLPDYVDHNRVVNALEMSNLRVEIRKRHIAYPRVPAFGWPPSVEIRSRDQFEEKLGKYHFHEEVLSDKNHSDSKEYVAFRMYHIIAHKKDI